MALLDKTADKFRPNVIVHPAGQAGVHDIWADTEEARHEYGPVPTGTRETSAYGGIVMAMAHDAYRAAGLAALRRYGRDGGVFCDLKSMFARDDSDLRL